MSVQCGVHTVYLESFPNWPSYFGQQHNWKTPVGQYCRNLNWSGAFCDSLSLSLCVSLSLLIIIIISTFTTRTDINAPSLSVSLSIIIIIIIIMLIIILIEHHIFMFTCKLDMLDPCIWHLIELTTETGRLQLLGVHCPHHKPDHEDSGSFALQN